MTQDRRWGYLSGLFGEDSADALARMDRLSEPSSDALGRVADLATVRATVESRLQAKVAAARAQGASWEDVARALGVSRQAAQQRYGRRPETAVMGDAAWPD